MADQDDPTITVNGVPLTSAQAATLRVAMETFAQDLQDDGALGDDEHGESMRTRYLRQIQEIRAVMYSAEKRNA